MSQVKKGSLVKVFYTGKFTDGTVFEKNLGQTPLEFKVGKGKLIKGFDRAVMGMSVGQTRSVTLKPAEAYGARDNDLVWTVALADLPEGSAEEGKEVSLTGADGEALEGVVTKIEGDNAVVDGNHPLAGKNLIFEIKLVSFK